MSAAALTHWKPCQCLPFFQPNERQVPANSALALNTTKGNRCLPTVCAEPLSQLEAEVKKQADLIVNLQSAALANSRAHNELVQHFQHLRAHVRRNNKSQQLLQDLSGLGVCQLLQYLPSI